jgi:RNA polymerase sigma factor, sigma-70 family
VSEEQFEKCIDAMVQSDKQGLRQVYEAYAGYIYTIVYGILGNKEHAEDVTSEFFIRLWEKADHYKPGNGHKGYLAAMARNMAIDDLRKYRREELTAAVHGTEGRGEGNDGAGIKGGRRKETEDRTVSVEEEVIGNMALKEALEYLKPAERQIVDMKVLGGLTFKEISKLLSMPMGTVTWKYQNSMKKLRRCGYGEV